jgi:hypothetical protein
MNDIHGSGGAALDVIRRTQQATMDPGVSYQSGTGKAFQFIAQSAAMAIQDATDNLRNLSTISSTAIGVAMSQLMSSGDAPTWERVIRAAQTIVTQGAQDFESIGTTATTLLNKFQDAAPGNSKGH